MFSSFRNCSTANTGLLFFFTGEAKEEKMRVPPTNIRALGLYLRLTVMMLLGCMWASVSHAEDDSTNCYNRTPAMVQKESRQHPDVRRKGEALVIRTPAKIVTLHDKIGPVEPYCYLYQKFLPKIQLHVFLFQWCPGCVDFGVVHARSGDIAYIPGWPKVSPDGKKFASIAYNFGGNYTPERIT